METNRKSNVVKMVQTWLLLKDRFKFIRWLFNGLNKFYFYKALLQAILIHTVVLVCVSNVAFFRSMHVCDDFKIWFFFLASYYINYIRANPPEFSGRFSTTIYKQKTFTLRIDDQILQKLDINVSSVNLI